MNQVSSFASKKNSIYINRQQRMPTSSEVRQKWIFIIRKVSHQLFIINTRSICFWNYFINEFHSIKDLKITYKKLFWFRDFSRLFDFHSIWRQILYLMKYEKERERLSKDAAMAWAWRTKYSHNIREWFVDRGFATRDNPSKVLEALTGVCARKWNVRRRYPS